MKGDCYPIMVYGFKTDRELKSKYNFFIGKSSHPGFPIYFCSYINSPILNDIITKISVREEIDYLKIKDFNNFAEMNGFKADWILALCGDLDVCFDYIRPEIDFENKEK